MRKVKIYNDFQGVETNNVFYPAGVHDVPEGVADRLVKDKRAEYVMPDAVLDNEPQFESVIEEKYYGAQAEPELRQDEVIHDVMTSPKTNKRSRK